MIPNKKNFCGGAFADWLEINLIDKCNGTCSWCVEKHGYHPKEKAKTVSIAQEAVRYGATNIMLLGGEPTLYEELPLLISTLKLAGKKVWLTTNGSLLTTSFVKNNLKDLSGINISIHHYTLHKNKEITGILLSGNNISSAINCLNSLEINTRLNCNCIYGAIDNIDKIETYIDFAKMLGVNRVRFAELKNNNDEFVDLAKVFNYKYGLNDNPFIYGCHNDVIIHDMPVNIRQMCGLQTSKRIKPINPQLMQKKVLYYNANLYNGWQIKKKGKVMNDKDLKQLLEDVAKGKKSAKEAAIIIKESQEESGGSGGCQY